VPEPVSPLPVSAPTTPDEPEALQPVIATEVPELAVQPQPFVEVPAPEPVQTAQRRDFTPPPKKRRSKLIQSALIAIVFIIVGSGGYGFMKAQAAKNNPDTVIKDALSTNFSLQSLETRTKTDAVTSQTLYDLSTSKKPIVSTATSINQTKGTVGIKGYGTPQVSYVSYTELPSNISKTLNAQTKNAWIRVRTDSILPKAVAPTIANLSDPRYQLFGPIVTANLEVKTRQQTIDFLIAHKVYGYDRTKVTKEDVDGKKMFVYPIKLDTSYLKISSQSVAVTMGFDPTEIQAATDAMGQLKGATVTIYINASDHTFAKIKIVKDGKTKTIDYSKHNSATVPDEPQTKLLWQNFAPVQTEIDSLTNLTKATY